MSKNVLAKTANKRQFLKGLTALMGASAVTQLTAGNALAAAFEYQQKDKAAERRLFSQEQFATLYAICETIIPETDTPSAAQLDVHGFVDHQLVVCHSKAEQTASLAIVTKINDIAQLQYKKLFVSLPKKQQTLVLEKLEAGEFGFSITDQQQFKTLKSLIVFGYLTTEIGATQVLAYQAIPGGFKGSVPYESIGKAYGSLAYY
ncbi:gluconate 2-dehydrogenase subunit 3 family protein [Thalassotalea sediminis]|uniref:gluconate 2-dehydrogenase subunit 3 family protein n=1 Tax=Thalassotalea sediminis TaxID=1759089 RepID=UPI00257477FB|nr:gluconate 2-dehydrogenase subunit 3 family protein [Thalassotalea sediminis]